MRTVLRLAIASTLLVIGCRKKSAPMPEGTSTSASASAVEAASVAVATAPSFTEQAMPAISASEVVAATPPPVPKKPLAIGAGTRVLVVGDSMATTFAMHLEPLVKAAGGTFAKDSWGSSTTVAWLVRGRLEKDLVKYTPDVVFVVLGSNEVFTPFPEKVAPQLRGLVAEIGARACTWIGPPLWKESKMGSAMIETERDNVAPCVYFDSSHLKLDRWGDGIHPNLKGGETWVKAAWEALVEAAPQG